VADGGKAAHEGAILQALDEHHILGTFLGTHTHGGHPAEILAEDVAVTYPELELFRLLATGQLMAGDLTQDWSFWCLHLDQGAGPEVAHTLGHDEAHEAHNHGEAEGQQGPGEPYEDPALS